VVFILFIMRKNYEPKEKYVLRMNELLDSSEDVEAYFRCCKTYPRKAIRVNTLKISPSELIRKLESLGWNIKQPFSDYPEILIIESDLEPGELGKAREHILGYYYSQEITSMMPIIALKPKSGDIFLDLCAAPGSKTTQAASMMENKGSVIANDLSMGRISILAANLERCGVTNTIVTRHPGNELCAKLDKLKFKFDKILVDAPCSGEGNIRCSPRTFLEWSEGLLKALSRKQRKIAGSAVDLLKEGGEMIYSTCTHAPEENEEIVQYLIDEKGMGVVDIDLPLKSRPGLVEWRGKKFDDSLKKCARIYPHDNDMEGFFVAKLKKK
jgi:tRNA (cytosine49-C5)-methyltransferase